MRAKFSSIILLLLLASVGSLRAQGSALTDTLQFVGDTLTVVRRGADEVVVRADKALFSTDTRKPVVTVNFPEAGYYRIRATILYSADQINESFFLDVCENGEVLCIDPCNPNLANKKVIVDDNGPTEEELNKDTGIFAIPGGVWTIHLNHYIDLAGTFPDKWTCYDSLTADCKTASGIIVDRPESVHLRELTIVRVPNASFDLFLQKRADRSTVFPGEKIAYTLNITNNGTETAHGLKLVDFLPDSVTVIESTVNPAPVSMGRDSLFWTFDTLAAGGTLSVAYSAKVVGAFQSLPDTLLNISRVTALCDTAVGDNEARVTVLVIPRPKTYDLQLTKRASQDTLLPGNPFSYTIEVVNRGRFDATDIFVNDALPEFISAQPTVPNAVSPPGDTLTWRIPALAVGDTSRLVVNVRVVPDAALPASPFEQINIAWLEAAGDTNATNDRDSASVFIKERFAPYDLKIDKSVDRTLVHPGEEVLFHLSVVNLGENPADNVVIRDNLPEALQLVVAKPEPTGVVSDSLVWQLSTLAVGDTFAVDLTVLAADDRVFPEEGLLQENFAWVSAEKDTNQANDHDSATVVIREKFAPYDLRLTKTALQSPVFPGDAVEFRLDVINLGLNDAFDATVFDVLPNALQFVSSDPSVVSGSASDTLSWPVPQLAVGDTFHVALTMQVPVDLVFERSGFLQENVGWVEARDDTNATNDRDTASVVIKDFIRYDLSLAKTASRDTILPGVEFNYRLQIENAGPDTAVNVAVWDVFPDELTLLNASPQPATSLDADTVRWQISQILPQGTASINLTARLPANVELTAPVTKENQALVSGEFDTNPGNDFATAITVCVPPPEFDCIVLDRNVFEPERIQSGLNQKLQILFELNQPGFVEMNLYDISGYFITNLTARDFPAGKQVVEWDGLKAQNGQRVGSGVYLIFFKFNGIDCIEKVIVAR